MCAAGACAIAVATTVCPADGSSYWLPANVESQREFERILNSIPDADNLRHLHDVMCSEPHPAGSPGDQRLIDTLHGLFGSYGIASQIHDIYPLLAKPVSASVTLEILREFPKDDRSIIQVDEQIDLAVREPEIPSDAFSSHDDLSIGWNAYSGSGSAAGSVVYANYGTKADFDTLQERGIDVRGAIVLARYGGNFRGFKAKFAEQAGAAGLLIYTDPADSGYMRGPMFPEGGWAHGGYIQNGSIKTLAYPGDPLTPGVEAHEAAARLEESDVALPGIPVQPIGWDAAQQIMQRMAGQTLPQSLRKSWQGGLPLVYRFNSGDSMRVRMEVQQNRSLMRTANVLGIVEGATHPQQVVIVGCHHDAWSFGAGDPQAGSIVLMEMARSFGEAARQGHKPARTVIFANWGAEEFGIIGSTEWVEANREHLLKHAVAYINLDMAAMGPNFGCSSAPSLKRIIADAARSTPQARGAKDQMVYDVWNGSGASEPNYGTLGGGSDHVGFYCHVGVPSCGLGASGSDGVSYHSNSDNLNWYRQVVGDDYEPALMLTRLGNTLVSRLANADLVPLDPTRYARDVDHHLNALQELAESRGMSLETASLRETIASFEQVADSTMRAVESAIDRGDVASDVLTAINQELVTLERNWLRDAGLDGRPWYRSLYAATDPNSGYGAWTLPGLRGAIEAGDYGQIAAELDDCQAVFAALSQQMQVIGSHLGNQN